MMFLSHSASFFEKLDEGGSYRILVTSRSEPERGKYPVIPVGEIDDAGLRRLFIEYANPDRTMIDNVYVNIITLLQNFPGQRPARIMTLI